MKCKNCGKSIRFVGGEWHHTWRIKTPEGESALGGSRPCAWRVRPTDQEIYAEPFDGVAAVA
jgi:hypothetical protein